MWRALALVTATGFLAARAADHFWPPMVVEEPGQPPMVKTYSTAAGIVTGAIVAGLLAGARCRR